MQKKIDDEILAFLSDRGEVQFKEIRDGLANLGFKELTFIRHLKDLKDRGEINREVKEDRSVWYSVSDRAKVRANVFRASSDLNRLAAETKSYGEMFKELEVSSISPHPLFERLGWIREDGSFPALSEDDPLYLTQTGSMIALYEGLKEAASGVIFSDVELPPDINMSPLAEAYLSVFVSLLIRNVEKTENYIKSLTNKFADKCTNPLNVFLDQVSNKEDRKFLSKRLLKGELFPEEEKLFRQVAKNAVAVEKEKIEWFINKLDFKFHISISFKSEKLAQALQKYKKKLSILWKEYESFLTKYALRELSKKNFRVRENTKTC